MKRWAVLCGITIIVILVLADTQHLGFLGVLYEIPYGDKVGHFLVFGLMSLLTNLAVFEGRPTNARVPLVIRASLFLAAAVGLEELSQIWIPWRTSSVWDLMASYLGVACFAWLAILIDRRRRSTRRA